MTRSLYEGLDCVNLTFARRVAIENSLDQLMLDENSLLFFLEIMQSNESNAPFDSVSRIKVMFAYYWFEQSRNMLVWSG